MGMRYWPCQANELSKEYARTFEEFRALESYVKSLDFSYEQRDISHAAYLLSYDDDIYGEMIDEEKQKIKDLWDDFNTAFMKKHPGASLYIDHVGNDIEGHDAPEDGWYMGVGNYVMKNPALMDLDPHIKDSSWVTWG